MKIIKLHADICWLMLTIQNPLRTITKRMGSNLYIALKKEKKKRLAYLPTTPFESRIYYFDLKLIAH